MIRALTCLVFCLSAGLAMGQSYEYAVSNASVGEGGRYNQEVSLTVMGDATVSGWSYSVCHDSTVSDICGAASTDFAVTLNPLGPPFFRSEAIDDRATSIPGSTDGGSQGIVIDQNGFFFFPDNSTNVVGVFTFVADAGTNGSTSTTAICSLVGNPVVEAVVVCCGGASVPIGSGLTVVDGTVTYGPAEPQWNFDAAALDVAYDGVSGAALTNGTQSVNLDISNTAANVINVDSAGFEMEISADPTFVTIDAINLGATLLALDQVGAPGNNCAVGGGGSGPDISMTNIAAGTATVQIQNTMFPAISAFPYCLRAIDWAGGTTAVSLDITVDTSSLAGDLVGTTTSLTWGAANSVTVNCPGDNLVALGGAANINLNDAVINLNPLVDLAFIRGDCNADLSVNIADAVWIISGYLAMPTIGSEGPCAEACDANSDSSIDVADVSYILSYRFSGGPAPAAPFPACDVVAGAPCDATSCP